MCDITAPENAPETAPDITPITLTDYELILVRGHLAERFERSSRKAFVTWADAFLDRVPDTAPQREAVGAVARRIARMTEKQYQDMLLAIPLCGRYTG